MEKENLPYFSHAHTRGGRKAESGGRIGGGVVAISSELGVAGSEEGLDGCGYIMAATTVFLRLIEVTTHLNTIRS